jgi:uncharacterized coiled-coil DUF342 family protein
VNALPVSDVLERALSVIEESDGADEHLELRAELADLIAMMRQLRGQSASQVRRLVAQDAPDPDRRRP